MTDNLKLIILNAAGLALDITLIIILLIIKHKENKKNMKYIRTKDKITKEPNDYANKLIECPNLKIADTIEELCDGLIVEDKDNTNNWFVMEISEYQSKDNVDKKYMVDRWNFHAFIKTDKGLIYVAKMNDKGELELL